MSPNKMERFTQRARRVLSLAEEEAERFKHNYIGTEHFLLGLIREAGGVGAQVLRNLGLEQQRVEELIEELTATTPQVPSKTLDLSPDTKRVLELAVNEARRMGDHFIGTEHLLLGFVRQSGGAGIDILKRLGISPEDVRRHTRLVLQGSPAPSVRKSGEIQYEPAEPSVGDIRDLRLHITEKTSGEVKTDVTLPAHKVKNGLNFVLQVLLQANRGGKVIFEADDFTIQVDLIYTDEGKEAE